MNIVIAVVSVVAIVAILFLNTENFNNKQNGGAIPPADQSLVSREEGLQARLLEEQRSLRDHTEALRSRQEREVEAAHRWAGEARANSDTADLKTLEQLILISSGINKLGDRVGDQKPPNVVVNVPPFPAFPAIPAPVVNVTVPSPTRLPANAIPVPRPSRAPVVAATPTPKPVRVTKPAAVARKTAGKVMVEAEDTTRLRKGTKDWPVIGWAAKLLNGRKTLGGKDVTRKYFLVILEEKSSDHALAKKALDAFVASKGRKELADNDDFSDDSSTAQQEHLQRLFLRFVAKEQSLKGVLALSPEIKFRVL